MAPVVELREDIEGDHVDTSDFFFDKIGAPVPVKPSKAGGDDSALYDPENLPFQALAVSERFRLIFVAHPSGFCVARTIDVMESAKKLKERNSGPSIVELSIVDVCIGKVDILSLSKDSSTLAASVGGDVHFYSVDSLLAKVEKPLFSCSVEESIHFKDIRWVNEKDCSCILLSNHGRLYHGNISIPPNLILEDVNAVDVRGNHIAVVRRKNLSILSSSFKEKLCISLFLDSWNEDCNVEVDSVRWIRPGCFVLGCYKLTPEGMEEYFVEVIRSKNGKINAYAEMLAQSFYDIFAEINDMVPAGHGPYLFFSYLEQCKLGIAAHKKNVSEHVVLFSWSLGEEHDDAVVVSINRDKWLPRIELQENGDDNLIVGLCIDKVSHREKVKVQDGVVEDKELLPHCVLLCLTVEGTLILFNLASEMQCTGSPEDAPLFSDEEEPAEVTTKHLQSTVLSRSEEGNFQKAPAFQCNESQTTLGSVTGFGIPVNNYLKPLTIKESLNQSAQAEKKDEVSKTRELKPFTQLQVSNAGEQQKLIAAKPLFGSSTQNLVGYQSAGLGQYSKSPLVEKSLVFGDNWSKPSSIIVAGKTLFPPFEESLKGFGQSVQNDVMTGQKSLASMMSTDLEVSSSQSLVGKKDAFARNPESRNPFQSNEATQDRAESIVCNVSTASFPGTFVGKLDYPKEANVPSPTVSSSAVQSFGAQKTYPDAEHIEPLPSIRASQIYFQENSCGISSNDDFLSKYKKCISHPGMSKMEPSISKQFGNVKEMVSELDMLLDSIEKKGGFKDSSIVSHKSEVEALEQGIETLSHQCTMWKSTMDERLSEAQQLLDKSVEVMARKVYLEGIFKQTTDDQYWDLWSRQKLSPELELKRRQITKLNQELTDQLILLERHFNALELNKFGDGIGGQGSRRSLPSRSASSRHLQSLQTLQKTMSSQIAAAEKLSDCLSKQMAVLKIDSPPVKPKNVKKELFETIGLPYDDSFSSPVTSKVSSIASKKIVPSSNSAAARDHQSRTNQLSATKTSEPESARRRRDSLGQGWASFEPSKTTVRRMSLQESQKSKSSRSPLLMHEQYLSSSERSTAVQKSRTTPSTLSQQPGKSGMKETSSSQVLRSPFESANDFQGSGLNQSATQRSPLSVSAAKSPFDYSQSKTSGGNILFGDKTTASTATQKVMTSPFNQSKPESNFQQMPSFSIKQPFETTSPQMKSSEVSEVSAASGKSTVMSTPSFEMVNQGSRITEGSVSPFGKRENSSSSTTTSTITQGKVQPGDIKVSPMGFKFDSSSAVSGFTSSSSPSTVPSNKTATMGGSLTFSRADTDSKQTLFTKPSFSLTTPSTSIPSISSSPLLFSEAAKPVTSTTDANQGSLLKFSSPSPLFSGSSSGSSSSPSPFSFSTVSSVVNSTSESQKPGAELDLGKLGPKFDVTTPKQALPVAPKPVNDESPNITEVQQASPLTIEISAAVPQESKDKATTTSPAMTISTQQALPATAGFQFPSQKTENVDVNASVEDDMDEEAPEATSDTPNLSLGSLNSFGLGTAPTSTPPKANPFGGPFGNTSTASSPFAPTPSSGGDLFRPASFSFQSPVTSQPSPPQSTNAFSGGFGSAPTINSQSPSGGQQVLGSVLGSFGQSRQIGSGVPGFGFAAAPSSGFGGGTSLSGSATAGGFAAAATSGGGFAAAATSGGGFASLASSSSGFGGGFAAAATSSGGGFGGFAANPPSSGGFGGFAGAAAPASGGGFGGFAGATPAGGGFGGFGGATAAPSSGGVFAAAAAPVGGSGVGFGNSLQGGGGFSSFGGGAGGSGNNPSSLFTQMRK